MDKLEGQVREKVQNLGDDEEALGTDEDFEINDFDEEL
jgi:hypothetical protein